GAPGVGGGAAAYGGAGLSGAPVRERGAGEGGGGDVGRSPRTGFAPPV
ncbi:RDD family protein, partial [Streptomyces inhibens]